MSLPEQLASYGRYHRDQRNIKTHFVGVPLVVLGLFISLGWIRFTVSADLSLSAAHIFFLATLFYYIKSDIRLALVQFPFSLGLLYISDHISRMPWPQSVGIFLAVFLVGWFFQLLGHYFEGKRPALVDNFWQIFNAPLFLAAEALFSLGLYARLKDQVNKIDLECSPR